jgi:hypothetical protein
MSQVGEKSLVAVQLVSSEDTPVLLNNTVWSDLTISGLSTKAGVTEPSPINFDGSTILVYGFNGINQSDEVHTSFQMPHTWKIGSAIYPHVHWTPTTTASGSVVWQLEYLKCKNGEFLIPATITATSAASAIWKESYAVFPSIAMTDSDLSCLIMCRLFRNPAASADSYAATAALLAIDIHYEIDSLGSKSELIK